MAAPDLRALPFVACPACGDTGLFLPFGQRVLTWRRRITDVSLAHEVLARTVDRVLNVALAGIALAGLVGHGVAVLLGASPTAPFVSDHPYYLFFWVAVFAGVFFIYRAQKSTDERSRRRIPRAQPGDALTAEAVAQLPPERFLDVSWYVSEDTEGVLAAAYRAARTGRDLEVTPLHLFDALLHSPEARFLFARLGIERRALDARVEEIVVKRTEQAVADSSPVFSEAIWRIVFSAYALAAAEGHPVVEVRHALRALFEWEESVATLLYDLGVERETVDQVLQWLTAHEFIRANYRRLRRQAQFKPKTGMNRALTAAPTPILDSISDDLTLFARANAFPPLIDRDDEFTTLVRILVRGGGDALLLGEPGTGKTVLLHGLAQRMVSEDVPKELKDKRLVLVDAARLFAEAGRGAAAGRLAAVVREVLRAKNVILAIEDAAELLTARAGDIDMSHLVIQTIERSGIQLVTTSTMSDYNQTLQRFPAFLRRFEAVEINEPDRRTAILISQAKASEIELVHSVVFTHAAVQFAVEGSDRYIPGERLPAKALKILEDAAVLVRETRGDGAAVMREDVARVLTRITSIPLTAATEEERERLLNIEGLIHARLIDQEEAVRAVGNALRRARAELRDPKRPIVNLLFLGPTGVGKTEMAKQVARVQFGSPDAMIRIDMSEYQQLEAMDRLLGAPDRGGMLTDAVRNTPYAVVLLDEFEKAHRDLLNVFLQAMDDGRLTDGRGNLVSFANAIMIATSNAGTDVLTRELQTGRPYDDIQRDMVRDILPKYFRPELINRFDGVILFRPLAFEHIVQVARILLSEVAERVKQRGVTLEVTDAAVTELAQKGLDPIFGARTLRRVIQDDVDAALATFLLSGTIDRRDRVILDKGGEIRVEKGRRVE